MTTYSLNQSVYITGHGIGVLKEIKSLSVQGKAVSLLAFEVAETGAKIMIPEGGAGLGQLRAPIDEPGAKRAMALLTAPPVPVRNKPNYKKWNRMIEATINSGDTQDLAAMVNMLEGQRAHGPLATNEQRLLHAAKLILRSELELVLGREATAGSPILAKMAA